MKSNFQKYRKAGCLFKLIKLAILALIVLITVAYFSVSYIADYALKKITAGTGIDAGVGTISMNLFDQKFDVRNFYMTNPPNYKKCNAFAFKDAFLDLDVNVFQLMSQKIVVVDEVKVVGLSLNLDLQTGNGWSALITTPKSNLTDISDTLQKSLGISDADKKQNTAKEQTPSTSEQTEPMRFIVKKIVFADGNVTGSFNGKGFDFPLPSFTLTDIGVRENGLTADELMVRLTGLIGTRVTIDAVKHLTKESVGLGKSAVKEGTNVTEDAAKSAEDATKSAVDAIKSIFN